MTPRIRLLRILPLIFLLPVITSLDGCSKPLPPSTIWYGEASLFGGKRLPFTMVFPEGSGNEKAYFRVGGERTEIPSYRRTPDSLIIDVPEYGASLRFRWNGSTIEGRYERYRADTTGFPVVAGTEAPSRSTAGAPAIRLTGSFRVFIGDPTAPDTSSSAVFWCVEDSVYGTIVGPSGDDGLYAGTQTGDTVRLGRFNGWQALMIEFVRSGEDWVGYQYVRQNPPDTIRMVPRPGAQPSVPAAERARIKDPRRGFRFAGVTTDGDTVSSESDRFRGKAVIIDIMGTWCHNCLDSAPVLESLRREYGPKGLEVVSLAFELTDDWTSARRNLTIFRTRHNVESILLFAGDLSAENVQKRIRSQIENFGGYPTTIFVDKRGVVTDVHTGFRGPGTGASYQSEIALYHDMVRRIVSE